MQTPTIGRIVHFNNSITDGDSVVIEKQAALVVGVHSDTCISVVAWNEYGTASTHRSVLEGDGANQWQWPPRA